MSWMNKAKKKVHRFVFDEIKCIFVNTQRTLTHDFLSRKVRIRIYVRTLFELNFT